MRAKALHIGKKILEHFNVCSGSITKLSMVHIYLSNWVYVVCVSPSSFVQSPLVQLHLFNHHLIDKFLRLIFLKHWVRNNSWMKKNYLICRESQNSSLFATSYIIWLLIWFIFKIVFITIASSRHNKIRIT